MKAETSKAYVAPAGHEEFVEEFRALLTKFPKAANRFRLPDMGESETRARVVQWECENNGEFGMDCRPVLQE